jgi:hypothetical protein
MILLHPHLLMGSGTLRWPLDWFVRVGAPLLGICASYWVNGSVSSGRIFLSRVSLSVGDIIIAWKCLVIANFLRKTKYLVFE